MKEKKSYQSAPLSEIAYQRIKDMIVTVKMRPGDQVDEGTMARELSIGRTPIREALFRLVAEELIQVRPGRGFFVRDITLNDLKALFETMMVLERSAVLLAARRIKSARIQELERINSEFRRSWDQLNYLDLTRENSRFHKTIYAAADNVFLNSFLNSLQNQSQRLAYICFSTNGSAIDYKAHAEHAIQDHENLITCFKNRDDEGAVSVITGHVRLFQNSVSAFTEPTVLDIALTA